MSSFINAKRADTSGTKKTNTRPSYINTTIRQAPHSTRPSGLHINQHISQPVVQHHPAHILPRTVDTSTQSIMEQVKAAESVQPSVAKPTGKYLNMSVSEIVDMCYETFQEIYKNRVKRTEVSSIVNGEIISTSPDNIFVNTTTLDDEQFDKKCQYCTKKLYNYQKDAIKMLRQLELSDTYEREIDGEVVKIHSNGYLLHLPIGSGKSLVFTFLALFYRKVPPKPIIISTSGKNIPENKMTQLKFYPYYYENVGYIEGKENCAVCIKDYNQRENLTVIITHFHLIDQLLDYMKSDFVPALMNPSVTKINVATDSRNINLNCHVLIVPAKPDIIARLSALSCEMPFSRVIVDDYTNMPGIEEYRQIRATSTIFVSGSGFERDIERIPPSYYTLRHIDVDKFSLVADPSETSKGILRNNVITFNLVGAQNEFSMYRFVNEIDEQCINKYNMIAANLYEPITTNGGKLLDYMTLNFVLKNYDKFNKSISTIEKDLASGVLAESKVKWFKKWKTIINQQSKVINQHKQIEQVPNPIYQALFSQINQIPQGVQPMLMQNCQVCGALPQQHKGWGMIACCCGAFFCANCLKSMCTRDVIVFNETSRIHATDNHHYYCVACHKADPVYVSNSTRHKDITNIQTYHLVDEFMDASDLKDCLHVDYYFKMFCSGFTPRYFAGRCIECETDVKGELHVDDVVKLVEPLIPKDQLALNCIDRINECLNRLEIKPAELNTIKPQLLVYGCPDYMQKRVDQYFKSYSTTKGEGLSGLSILFKNSLSELIGLHQNILGILVWNNPKNIDEIQQLIGRIVRLNNWNNPVYFYITCTGAVNISSQPENKKLGMDTVDLGVQTDTSRPKPINLNETLDFGI